MKSTMAVWCGCLVAFGLVACEEATEVASVAPDTGGPSEVLAAEVATGDTDDGTCTADCTAVHGTASCASGTCTTTCDEGWEGEFCDVDTDECASDPCEVGETCTNVDGGYVCDCDPETGCGEVKAETFTTCTPNPCHNGGT